MKRLILVLIISFSFLGCFADDLFLEKVVKPLNEVDETILEVTFNNWLEKSNRHHQGKVDVFISKDVTTYLNTIKDFEYKILDGMSGVTRTGQETLISKEYECRSAAVLAYENFGDKLTYNNKEYFYDSFYCIVKYPESHIVLRYLTKEGEILIFSNLSIRENDFILYKDMLYLIKFDLWKVKNISK